MKATDIIARTVGARADQETLQWVDSTHMKQYRILSFAGIAGCFACIGGSFVALPLFVQISGLAVGAVCIVLRSMARKNFEEAIASSLDMQCDPALYCRRTLAFLAGGRPAGDFMRGVWEYAYGLLWQGKWDEAIKLMRTLEPYADMPDVAYAYDSFMADCAFALRDPDKLRNYIDAMKAISQRRVAREAHLHAAELEPLHELLVCERDGHRERALGIADAILADTGLLPIERVTASLHKAECTADRDEKRALLTFVERNGGSTWCAARARTLLRELEA